MKEGGGKNIILNLTETFDCNNTILFIIVIKIRARDDTYFPVKTDREFNLECIQIGLPRGCTCYALLQKSVFFLRFPRDVVAYEILIDQN